MAIIGTFTKDGAGFAGTLETLSLKAKLSFEPVKSKRTDNAPDYRVLHVTENIQSEIGAAWNRTSREGAQYLSVSLDDPGFPEKRYCRLVKTCAERGHSLFWDRPRPDDAPIASCPNGAAPRRPVFPDNPLSRKHPHD